MVAGDQKPDVEEVSYGRAPEDWDDMMQRVRVAGAVSISSDTFERLVMGQGQRSQPYHEKSHAPRWKHGNALPIALVGFLISLTPLSCDLMKWGGGTQTGVAGVGTYFFFGGVLQTLVGLLEWIAGNTFPSVVFSAYGAFFFSFGATLYPGFGAYSSYAPAGESAAAGLATRGFNANFGLFALWMTILSLAFLICSIRTNVAFVVIFTMLVAGFAALTATYLLLADSMTTHGTTPSALLVASGAFFFTACVSGWWVFMSLMLAAMEFPFQIPLGDLSHVLKPKRKSDSGDAA